MVIEGAMGADGETLVADREESLVGLSKTRGVGSLTAIGCDGGAEDRMVLCALRHQIVRVRNLWLGWLRNRRCGGLRGWRGLLPLALGLALLL